MKIPYRETEAPYQSAYQVVKEPGFVLCLTLLHEIIGFFCILPEQMVHMNPNATSKPCSHPSVPAFGLSGQSRLASPRGHLP